MEKATVDLAALAAGARVAWIESAGWSGSTAIMATVERLTRTQIIVQADRGATYRFRRTDGGMIGGKSWGPHLQDPLNGRVVNLRAAARARDALRAVAELGKPKILDAAAALGMLDAAWREITDATKEIATLLEDLDNKTKGTK